MYLPHTQCRACGYARPKTSHIKAEQTESLVPVFDLGIQPLANDFAGPNEELGGFAPLKVMFCPRCTLGQLSVVVRPEILYSRYSYVTSTSDMMSRHFESLADVVGRESFGNRMLEIGSNDGRMLDFFAKRGMKVCGIDPAANLARVAQSSGLRTIVGLFNAVTATEAASDGPFDVVFARHVFCHANDWKGFVGCLNVVSHPDTLVAIEAPYVCDMLERGEFDTIYHEHTSYMNVRAMMALLSDTSFELCGLEHFPIHGGALLLLVRPRKEGRPQSQVIQDYLMNERASIDDWERFSLKAKNNIWALGEFVREQRAANKRVVGFGASAKSTVWVNACGFTRKELSFITDNTPHKQWKLSPGTDIPIVDEGAILRELPDYAVCFAWNFRDEVLEKNQRARDKGVKFVFPIPFLEVV